MLEPFPMKTVNIGDRFRLQSFSKKSAPEIIDRLIDLGLYPGVDLILENYLKVSNVYVVRFHQTLLALNEEEFLCLQK